MKISSIIRYLVCFILLLAVIIGCLASCNAEENETETDTGTETAPTEDFDFIKADLNEYMSLDASVYSGVSITVSDMYEVTDANVQKYVKGLLEQYKQPVKITDRPVKKGDTVYIYYEGLLDGKAFQGGTYAETDTSEPADLKIGSGSFIAGFEDGLIGVIPEETSKENPVALNLTFPENYHSKDLAGKAVVFNVYIKYISNETYVPEYTKETITDIIGFEAEGEDVFGEFEDYIRTLLKEEQDEQVLSELSKLLLEGIEVKSYPEQSVDYWYANYCDQIQQYVDYYAAYGYKVTFEEMAIQMLGLKAGDNWKAELTEFAENTVKSKMVYYYIAQQNGITVSGEEFDKAIDELVEYYKENGYTYTKEQIIEGIGEAAIRETALFEKVDKMLLEGCTVSFKKSESK
ncbi:MAG: FKBP-type peptidyl-prolyl cis-trans isomerase [Clostridia bacterium]|nr:FKBP-type peptidyl-prolyl cis-trans isomerase [Clostridia bacterium]